MLTEEDFDLLNVIESPIEIDEGLDDEPTLAEMRATQEEQLEDLGDKIHRKKYGEPIAA